MVSLPKPPGPWRNLSLKKILSIGRDNVSGGDVAGSASGSDPTASSLSSARAPMREHADASSSSTSAGSAHRECEAPKHLVMEANGLFGYPDNWKVINEHLQAALDGTHYIIFPSHANQRTETFQGIDVCGERLADEIRGVVQRCPSLRYVSLLGHSLGGLMLRYAAARLYEPATGTIAGLKPLHFISMATPHLGCDAYGESQVPFIGWLSGWKPLHEIIDRLAVPVTGFMFHQSGKQLFMAEEDNTGPEALLPLLVRLVYDDPEAGLYGFSSLAAFRSRTCYANSGGDHLVGWANSSLRFVSDLPDLALHDRASTPVAKGVVRDDPPEQGFHQHSSSSSAVRSHALEVLDVQSAGTDPLGVEDDGGEGAGTAADGASGGRTDAGRDAQHSSGNGAAAERSIGNGGVGRAGSAGAGTEGGGVQARPDGSGLNDIEKQASQGLDTPGDHHVQEALLAPWAQHGARPADDPSGLRGQSRSEQALAVLQRLQLLPWSRVDCSWRDAALSIFAHNHIQVTRGWLNFEGKSVCKHLAQRFVNLEAEAMQRDSAYASTRQSTAPPSDSQPPDR